MWSRRKTCNVRVVNGLLILLMAWKVMVLGIQVKVFCIGEELKLVCSDMSVLVVHVTSLSLVPANSNLCRNINTDSIKCNISDYSNDLKNRCNGKSNCSVKEMKPNMNATTCNHVVVASVLYDCEKPKVGTTLRPTNHTTSDIHASSLQPINSNKTRPTSIVRQNSPKLHAITYTFFTLLSTTLALKYVQDRPKHVILCIVLSISAGIVLLILSILAMVCFERFLEERKKNESNQLEISLPLLVSPPNPITSTEVASAPPSEVGSSRREGTIPRIQSFRRSHSVDEGTQTEAGLDSISRDEAGISDNEARELGYLVDIMKYYNSNLDNLSTADANSIATSEAQNRTPRTVDRYRQTRLSSTTYSSSNNSEAGENNVHKKNHVDNGISTTPRYNTFGHKNHSFKHYDTLNLENGPRRTAGRTRVGYPNTVSDRVSARPYGTLG